MGVKAWFGNVWAAVKSFFGKMASYARTDGFLHIIACYILTIVLVGFSPLWVAVGVTLLVGIMVESIDFWTGKGTPEWHDFVCDVIGIAMAVVMYYYLVFCDYLWTLTL